MSITYERVEWQRRGYRQLDAEASNTHLVQKVVRADERADALSMMADWFETLLGTAAGSVRAVAVTRADFEIVADDTARMISLLLRRQRQKSGLSLAQAADRLGARSRNAYARYEQGRTVPTVAKLDELLKAVAPGRDLLVGQSRAA